MQQIIRAENIKKQFGTRTALAGITLEVYKSEVFGIFGFSGSGKTTLIYSLAGIIKPDAGTVTMSTNTSPAIWFEKPAVDPQLTPFETLWISATLYGIPRRKRRSMIRDILSLVGLDDLRNKPAISFSKGMLKQLEAARALLSPSEVLLADEPMADIDPPTRERLWEHLLARRASKKHTILMATSRPQDAEICDRIALIHEGRLIACGTLDELRSATGPEKLIIQPIEAGKSIAKMQQHKGITAIEQNGSLIIELSAKVRPSEIIKQMDDEISAVRLSPRKVDSILAELIAKKEEPTHL
ncbi:MAG: ABC transporter ATP-binding protein [Armatimonadota bacterium]|nr:ABC transporter ATP-binding protein [Armatimonadota bacterium]